MTPPLWHNTGRSTSLRRSPLEVELAAELEQPPTHYLCDRRIDVGTVGSNQVASTVGVEDVEDIEPPSNARPPDLEDLHEPEVELGQAVFVLGGWTLVEGITLRIPGS